MGKLNQTLKIVNKVLESYRIEPITEEEVWQAWSAMESSPVDPVEEQRRLDDLWRRIREREQNKTSIEAARLPS